MSLLRASRARALAESRRQVPFVERRDYLRIVVRNRALYGALYDW